MDKKITELDAVVTPTDADLLTTVTNLSTTPANEKITWTVAKAFLKTYFDGLYDAGDGDFLADGSVPMTGRLDLATGTTTKAPIKLTAGTNLTTELAGALEFDGSNLFLTV